MTLPRRTRFYAFLLASAALIAAAALAAGFLVGAFFERHVLAEEEAQTVEMVLSQARQHLTPAGFAGAVGAETQQEFREFLAGLPRVFRMKVFDPSGRIVWSNEPRLIGQIFPDNTYLHRALAGKVTTVLEQPQRSEHVYERTRRYVAEAYVPITFAAGARVVAVVETYKDVTGVVLDIQRAQRRVWLIAGTIGLGLWGALAFVVWQASAAERRATRQLEETHERIAAILSGITDQMVIVDRDMRVVWMNAAAQAAVGPGAVGQVCYEAMGATPETCAHCPAMRTLGSGGIERGVRRQKLPSGETRYLDLVTAPLRDATGEVRQVLEVARDITDLVEMETRLKDANQALLDAQTRLVEKERLAAVGEVVVGLHHAILNPLTGVLGALQVLKGGGADAAARAQTVADAEAEIRKVERLIRRLDDLRRADGTPYVGGTTMLDFDRSCAEGEKPPDGPGASR